MFNLFDVVYKNPNSLHQKSKKSQISYIFPTTQLQPLFKGFGVPSTFQLRAYPNYSPFLRGLGFLPPSSFQLTPVIAPFQGVWGSFHLSAFSLPLLQPLFKGFGVPSTIQLSAYPCYSPFSRGLGFFELPPSTFHHTYFIYTHRYSPFSRGLGFLPPFSFQLTPVIAPF